MEDPLVGPLAAPALLFPLLLFLAQARLDRVHLDADSGEITLAGRTDALREHSRPTKWDVVTDLVVFRGRLLAIACMDFDGSSGMLAPWAYSNGAEVLEYSPRTDEWTVLRDMEGSMFFNARVVDGRLLLPEYYPLEGRSRLVHSFDGVEWTTLGLLPEQNWHVMDAAGFGGRLYASGAWRDQAPVDEDDPKTWWNGYGHVFESADGGKTWRDIRRTSENGRVLDLVEFRGRLWGNERGHRLIAWDGKRWEEVPVRLSQAGVVPLGNANLYVFAGRIFAAHADLVYTYDGAKWDSYRPGFLDVWVEGKRAWGLRENGKVAVSEDGVHWTLRTREGVPPKEFDRIAQAGRPLHRGSVALHRGRLFVGTGAEGRIWAAPYEEKGSLTSEPAELPVGSPPALLWEAEGAGARVRWRTAATGEDLEKAPWKDATASPARIDPPRKHRWVQWRVQMESDGRRTPVVRGVRWETP